MILFVDGIVLFIELYVASDYLFIYSTHIFINVKKRQVINLILNIPIIIKNKVTMNNKKLERAQFIITCPEKDDMINENASRL